MKLFIFSDTHDRLSKINDLRNRIINFKPDLIIHLGDFVSPFFIYNMFKDIKGQYCEKIILIKGNNDGDLELLKSTTERVNATFYSEYFKDKFYEKNIFAIHKPDFVENIAKSCEFDFIFYGHTHKKELKKIGNATIINPGTASGYLAEYATYLTIDLKKDEILFNNI